VPDILRLGPSGSGVNLLDTATYATRDLKQKPKRTKTIVELIGDDNVILSQSNFNYIPRSYVVSVVCAGYQAKLTAFTAVETQLAAAEAFSMQMTATPIYLQEQFSNQTARLDYLVVSGEFDEEERPDFVVSHKTGILRLILLRPA
jgi:hypothetical protein